MKVISRKQVEELKSSGHVVFIYPRKGEVRVDGYKLYKLKKEGK